MRHIQDLTGKEFGELTVTHRLESRKGHSWWRVRCACGSEKDISRSHLLVAKSCGCMALENNRKAHTRHGMKRTPTWKSWRSMKQRCLLPTAPNYAMYGGRGISVCLRWRDSFEAFLGDMGERPSPGHSIDRIDGNRGYEPGNCRWATAKAQARNTRTNRLLAHGGRTLPLAAWAEELGVGWTALDNRLRSGWSVERTLTTPVKECRPRGR